MAYIKILKDEDLAKGTSTDDVYPVSTTQALYSQDSEGNVRMTGEGLQRRPEKLEERLEGHEEDASLLHRQTEKLTVSHTNNKSSSIFEITGSPLVMTLTGSATIDTYGDSPSTVVSPDSLENKQFTVVSPVSGITPEHPEGSKSGSSWVVTYTVPNETWLRLTPGTYTTSFGATYNSISKDASKNVTVALRKYFSYAESVPTDTASLEALRTTGVSDIKTTTEYIFTVPAIDQGEMHIYFAVPSPMTITRILQPSVGITTPFAFHAKGTVDRIIDGVTYTYNLYESGTNASSIDGLEDTHYAKELQITIDHE